MKHSKYILTAIMLISMLAVAAPVGARSGVENPTVPNWWNAASPPPPVKGGETPRIVKGNGPVAFLGVNPDAPAGIESLSGSNVTFNPSAGGDTCSIPGATQTFCFDAHSYTNDWEYVYNVWLRFPPDWTVTNAYVVGTPTCTGGGSWGTFAWSFETAPYEINISHPRYQATTDDCVATYCVEVVAGTGVPYAYESWYWDGDEYGGPPHAPCSSDNYTPPSMSGEPCDEAVNPQAAIPPCALDPGVYLLPESQDASGCNGEPQVHNLSLLNNTGADGTFSLSYSVPSANGTLTGPASVFAPNGAIVPFQVTLTPDLCVQPGAVVLAQIDASGNGYSDSAVINKTVLTEPRWEAIPASAPGWPGYGYPRDGCTAMNAAGDWVTYEFGDTTSFYGFWGYNHTTNTWFQPNPTGTPADRWAPDWAYDPETNLCYVTGGATAPGGGNLTDAYVFDPVANAFTALGNFTSMRDFHNSWVGRIDGVKYLCIGGGVDVNSVLVQSTQCYDLAQAAPGVWNPENAQMAPYPTDPFGAADGVLHAPTGDQFWYVGGAINAFSTVTDEARYWDDADNAWHFAGNTGFPRYRVEGDFFRGEFWQLGGSSGGFSPTADTVRGSFDGVNWNWTPGPLLNNIRMDNIVAVTELPLVARLSIPSSNAPQVTLPAGAPQSLSEWLAAGQPALAVQPVAPAATAQPDTLTYYTNRGDFDADFPGLPVEGYENGSMASGTLDAIPHPLDASSSNAYFDPGDVLPGIQFWASTTHSADEIAVLGEQFMSNPSKTAVANYFTDGYIIVFNPPVSAVGLDLQDFMGSYSCQVDIYDTNGYLTSVTSACNEAGVFWGVASDADPITQLVITDLGGGAEGADNVAFGGEVTPSGTLWSVDGYGASSSAYVEKLVFCPVCDLQGWLEGTVLDGDTQPVLAGWRPAPGPETVYNPAAVVDRVGGAEPAAVAPVAGAATWAAPEAVLWDNGPLVTHPAGCATTDASRLQTTLGMNTLGFGHQYVNGYRMADDFTVTDPAGWQIDTITFFAYQTGAPSSPSPITGVYYQIWNGPPDNPASSVVFGDLTTNRLLSSTFSGIQRDSETTNCANNRYIFADVASAGVTLPPGTYWLDWMTDGSLSSGPWAPPVTILGQTTTGNALQYTTAWAPALDTGTSTQQDLPFIIQGEIVSGALNPPCVNATVTINPGNITVGVDPVTGHYGPVQLVQGDYTVVASAPGYSTESAVVTIVDGAATVQDFTLWRPVVDVDPLSFSVYAEPSDTVVLPLDIANLGHLPLDWEIVEIPTGMAVEAQPAASGEHQQTPAAFGVDPFIFTQMEADADGNTDFFIAFRDTADLSGAYAIADRAARVQWVREALRSAADRAQARVRAWLDAQGIAYQVFTVDNTILVNGNRTLLETLQAQFPEISGFHGNHTYAVLPLESSVMGPLQETAAAGPEYAAPSWDLNIMNVPQVWDQLGVTGEGAIVANVDTGVYYQHPALFPNYLCGSGPHTDCWLDPQGGSTAPNDSHGHGTGTMSQMAADNADSLPMSVGDAPDAGWIACVGCPGGSCPDTALNACADWLVNTTPNTPHVVNNSWGTWSAVCDYWYQGKLQAYRAAGILPVFAAGNIGNGCASSTPPANNPEAFAVGATTSSDVQASFSSTGPGACADRVQFPDVSAPGDATCGATNSGGYSCGLSGTSFAAPRAAGCLALMFSANPFLTIDEAEDILRATADDKPNSDCGSPQPDPNYRYGDGRVNCYEAVLASGAGDLDWVSTDPVTGTIPPDDDQTVDVIFHCTPDQQGWILTGVLRVRHNDPCAPPIDIPVELTCGQPLPPDIDVVPPALSTTLVAGEQDVQTLNINNLGTLALDWNIIEHNPLAGGTAFVPVNVRGGESNGETVLRVHSPTPLALARPEAPANPNAVLWDQPLSAVNQNAYVNQDFSDYPDYSSFLADDFVNAEPWTISTIFVPGNGWNGFTTLFNATALTWQVYADCGGVPCGDPAGGGSAPVWTLTLPPTDAQVTITNGSGGMPSNTTLNLATSLNLPAGHWWLVFYPTMGFAAGGQYGRQPADTTNGYTGQFINPGGGFGYGTAWQAWTVIGATQQDIAFRLEGEAWLPPECEPVDIPWASVNPTSGTTPGHDTVEVDVTFDSTGMAGGYYSANLCVESNDPDEPYVIVPLEMTVLDPQDIVVTPASLEATLCPDETEEQTVTICNNGDVPLDWRLMETDGTLRAGPVALRNGPQVTLPAGAPRSLSEYLAAGRPSFTVQPAAPTAPAVVPDALTFYSDRGTFNSDFPGLPIEGYENGSMAYGTVDAIPHPLDASSSNAYFDPGDVLPGIQFWASTTHSADEIAVLGEQFMSNPSKTAVANYFVDSYIIVFDPPVTAVGLDLQDFLGSYSCQVDIYDTNGYLTSVTSACNEAGVFWGVASDLDPITQIVITDLGGGAEGADNVAFGGPPPYDIPWLSETPTEGTVPGNTCVDVTVTFDATGLAYGTYTGGLRITSNDPDTPQVNLPVTLNVIPCGCVELESASFVWSPLHPYEDELVTFTGDYAPISATTPIAFAWDFGDGGTGSGQIVTHAFDVIGVYPVELTVSNPCSQVTITHDVQVFYWMYLPFVFRNSP